MNLKTVLLGTTLVLIVMMGGVNFLVGANASYNISNPNATLYNQTLAGLQDQFNANTAEMQSKVQGDGSFTLDIATALGFAWNSAISFFSLLFNAPVILVKVIGDVFSNGALGLPGWLLSLITGGISVLMLILFVSYVIGRSTDDT